MARLRSVPPTADLEKLRRAVETALRDFNVAQEALGAALDERRAPDALVAAQAQARDHLFLVNQDYRQAVMAFVAKGADPSTE